MIHAPPMTLGLSCLWIPLPPPPQARSSRDAGKSPSSLGLADFDLLRVIGRGSYAKVLLVQLKKTERIYAMKVVKKELVNDDEVRCGGGGSGGASSHLSFTNLRSQLNKSDLKHLDERT